MSSTTITSEPTTAEKLHGLRWNTLGDSANSVFVQFTFFGSIFVLFLSELGLGKSQIGFLLSLFPFAGLIAPFIAPSVARFGYKRTFLTFWGIRKAITAGLLLVPLMVAQFGSTVAVIFVGLIVTGFALARAISETGRYPWMQEYIPNTVRGKYSAINNVFTTVAGLIAVALSGFVLEHSTGLTGYMTLIAIGVFLGGVSFWAYGRIPGGAPTAPTEERPPRDLWAAATDRNFRNYLIGIALITLAMTPMVSFLPLFMREQVGLSDSQVVLLQNGVLVGGLFSVYMWGWAADRFGSTPIMLSSIALRLFLPILWLLMPRYSDLSLYAALGIAVLQGATNMGWGIGSARLLFVSVVPPSKKADYLALYYAWIGVTGGVSQLIGGWLLALASDFSGSFLTIQLDSYTPLFLLGLGLPLIAIAVLRRIHVANEVGMGQFAGILLSGNPLTAVESMIRYHAAKDEEAVVISTERLGQAKSLLTLDELLESLQDPRFNVRLEAIMAIGRNRPDERFINALAGILHGKDPALSVMAAWALGRIGSPAGQPPLRDALDSHYRSIRGHSARSLATLKDDSIIETLQNRLHEEQDHGLRVAYAAALGQLRDVTAAPAIVQLLDEEQDELTQAELSLALARLVGEEGSYVQLLRQIRIDLDTAVSQAVLALTKQFPLQADLIGTCATAFSAGQYSEGIELLTALVAQLSTHDFPEPNRLILTASVEQLNTLGIVRLEYLMLVLFSLANV